MRFVDLTGRKFGRWTVLGRGPDRPRKHSHRVQWICRCECGAEGLVSSSNLVQGISRSCGCLHIDTITTHDMTGSPEHQAWTALKSRCYTRSNIGYPFYGGRGIKVCARWLHSFESFLSDMGPRPGPEYSVDRIDPNRDYSPENCRWATRAQQDSNRRSSRLITFNSRTQTVADWARETGLSKSGLLYRLNAGWSVADALTIPPDRVHSKRLRSSS
jgi:hypothetical protein